jgi:hypothetical protein
MVEAARGPSPNRPDETPRRLSSDEPLWEEDPEPKRASPGAALVRPVQVQRPAPAAPADHRPLWRRALRVNLLLGGAAIVLLLVGFLLGATLAGGRPPPAATRPAPAATVTSVVVQQAPPPRECVVAIEQADIAITYLVANIRDQRLTKSILKFAASRRACQRAVR